MGWDELSAIGSIAATFVLLVGSIAAVIQLRHMRLANQMGVYLDLMRQINSAQIIEAREYVESHNFEDPEALRNAFEGGLDQRILMLGGFYQLVARLINFRVLDRDLFAPIAMTAPKVWQALRPLVYEMRKRSPGNPRWMDLEYMVYSQRNIPLSLKRYSPDFRARVGLDAQLAEWSRQVAEAMPQNGE